MLNESGIKAYLKALDYHKKSFEYANKIKDLRIKEEMIELANTALNREKWASHQKITILKMIL